MGSTVKVSAFILFAVQSSAHVEFFQIENSKTLGTVVAMKRYKAEHKRMASKEALKILLHRTHRVSPLLSII